MMNNTIYGNTSTGHAGGIFISPSGSAELYVYNNIIWGNFASGYGDDIYLSGTGSNNKYLYNNNFHEKAGTLWNFTENNIDVDPLFVDTTTDDYHLTSGSLCLNVGEQCSFNPGNRL